MTVRCYACDAEIKFSPAYVSESGRPIPLELYGAPHNCPNKKLNNNRPKPTTRAKNPPLNDQLMQQFINVYKRLNAQEVRIEALERENYLQRQQHEQQRRQQAAGGGEQ
jgi:hypothetical protein